MIKLNIVNESHNFQRNIEPKKAMRIGLQFDDIDDAREYIIDNLPAILNKKSIPKDIIKTNDETWFNEKYVDILYNFIDNKISISDKSGFRNPDETLLGEVHNYLKAVGFSKGRVMYEAQDFQRNIDPKDAMGTGIKSKMGRDKGYEPLYNDEYFSIEKYFNKNTGKNNLVVIYEPQEKYDVTKYGSPSDKSFIEYPIMYDNGTIAYDNPFHVPEYIQQLVKKYYHEIRKK